MCKLFTTFTLIVLIMSLNILAGCVTTEKNCSFTCSHTALYDVLDLDKDNKISEDEMLKSSSAGFKSMLKKYDKNKDNKLSESEFYNYRTPVFFSRVQGSDLNSDGVVSSQEFFNSRDVFVTKVMALMDMNKDNIMSDTEQKDYWSGRYKLIKDDFDRNKDGGIIMNEYLASIKASFAYANTNKDGVIDRSEYQDKVLEKQDYIKDQLYSIPKGYVWDNPGFICTPDGAHCLGFHLAGPGSSSWGGPGGGNCVGIHDPWHPDFDPWDPCVDCFPWCY